MARCGVDGGGEVGGAGEVGVDGVGDGAAFGDGPDDEGGAAVGVAADEDAGGGGLPVGAAGDGAAGVQRQPEAFQEGQVFDAVEADGEQDQVGGLEFGGVGERGELAGAGGGVLVDADVAEFD